MSAAFETPKGSTQHPVCIGCRHAAGNRDGGNVMSVQYAQTNASMPAREICAGCGIVAWLLPAGLGADDLAQVERLCEHRRVIRRDHYLVHAGERLTALHFVNSGSMKICQPDADGRTQLIRFALSGEILGMGAIDTGTHPGHVIALEDSSCCSLRYADLMRLGQSIPALQRHLHQVMSQKINRNHKLMLMLGSMNAEERLVSFLLDLSHRHAARGYSASQFRLSMTRRDIGSYLGLNLETVSRLLAHLKDEQILAVSGRDITIKDSNGLRQISEGRRHVARLLAHSGAKASGK